jgi:guanylate kinase
VSGPSGSGKDTLVDGLRRLEPAISYSVSVTTRSPRPGEIDGVHYRFVDRPEFDRMRAGGELLEAREYAGNWYGTPKRFVTDALASGRDLVMKPEVNGAMAVKRAFPNAVLVFLTVGSPDVLRQRLFLRSTETVASIAQRIAIAGAEAGAIDAYDYLIVNDDYETALGQLHAVVVAERLKVARVHPRE